MFRERSDPVLGKEIKSLKKASVDGHAGEEETSMMYYINPGFVDMEALNSESGLNQQKLSKLPFAYAGIGWYSQYPNHFASDISTPNEKLGELLIKSDSGQLAELIKFLKADNTIEELQEEFFSRAQNPLQK